MKKVTTYIQSERKILLALGILVLFSLFCWLLWKPARDFGLNFFTEMLGVAVTIIVIDRLIEGREQRKSIPLKLASYEDIRIYTARYIAFWTQVFRDSVPEDDPKTIELFFSKESMSKVQQYLYMDSEPNVSPKMRYSDWIVQNAKEFKEKGNNILDRHGYNLDPEVYGHVHALTESMFNGMLLHINSIEQTDARMKFPRVRTFGNYSFYFSGEDYTAVLGLIRWCEETYLKLKGHSRFIKESIFYFPQSNKKIPPKCMIPDDVLKKQKSELEEFIKQNK